MVLPLQEWSEESRAAPFYFRTGFRSHELPWEVCKPEGRLDQAKAMADTPLNEAQFPEAAKLMRALDGTGTHTQALQDMRVAGARFELETRFWLRTWLAWPELFATFTIPGGVGQYFLFKVLKIVEPTWVLAPPDTPDTLTPGMRARLDEIFTAKFHQDLYEGLDSLGDAVFTGWDDFKMELKFFWVVHGLTRFKDEWLYIATGEFSGIVGDANCKLTNVSKFAYNQCYVKASTNLMVEQGFSCHNWVGDNQLGPLLAEMLLQGVNWVLRPWRERLRSSEFRQEGDKKERGLPLKKYLSNKAQLAELCRLQLAHKFPLQPTTAMSSAASWIANRQAGAPLNRNRIPV